MAKPDLGPHGKNKNQRSLQNFVYGVLTRRIIITVLIISAILTLILIVRERTRVSDAVIEMAHNRIQLLLVRTREYLKKPGVDPYEAFRQSLVSFRDALKKLRMGQFVYSHFYDRDGNIFAESVDGEYPPIEIIKSLTSDTPLQFPVAGVEWHKVVRIEGRPHVHMAVPVTDLQGEVVAYAEGVFAVSDEALADMRRGLLGTIFWVVAIVLATSAILYPVIINLMRRLAKFSEDLLESHLTTIQILGSAIAKRDSDTSAHNFRVTIMAVRVASPSGRE
jgi:hypothetical protein